jgi:AAA domain, putative AbiEii toxin, Type IV TA system
MGTDENLQALANGKQMFKSFSISRFRGLQRCDLNEMRRVTLLTGKNNTGKTSVLEAMFIHSGNQPNLLMVASALRGMNRIQVDTLPTVDAPWLSTFCGYDDSQPIKLTSVSSTANSSGETRTVQISTVKNQTEVGGLAMHLRNAPSTPEGLAQKMLKLMVTEGRKPKSHTYFMYYDNGQPIVFPPPPMVAHVSRFLSPYSRDTAEDRATQFSRLQTRGDVEGLVVALRKLEPRLKDLALVFNGEPSLHGDIGLPERKYIPLAVMGDGLSRVANLLIAIANTPGGAVFVDDIDTGLHHSVMQDFWSSVRVAAEQFNVQVIASTHSEECIRAATSSFKASNKLSELSLIRLQRGESKIDSYTYEAEEVLLAFDSGLEVR